MSELLAALKRFAAKIKDDPGITDVVRFAGQELHDEVDRLLNPPAAAPVETPPAETPAPAETPPAGA